MFCTLLLLKGEKGAVVTFLGQFLRFLKSKEPLIIDYSAKMVDSLIAQTSLKGA